MTDFVRRHRRDAALIAAGTAFFASTIAVPAAVVSQEIHPSTAAVVAVAQSHPAVPSRLPPAVIEATPVALHRMQGQQEHVYLDKHQQANVRHIVKVVKDKKLPPRAATIAVATAYQESWLKNLKHPVDADSLGLFQQRPSQGWGTPRQLVNPDYSTSKFLNSLKKVPNWQHKPLAAAAQDVQGSAYPDRYARWEQMSADLVRASWSA